MAPKKRPAIVNVEVLEPPRSKRRKQTAQPRTRRTTRAAAAAREARLADNVENAQPGQTIEHPQPPQVEAPRAVAALAAPATVPPTRQGDDEESRGMNAPRDGADLDEIRTYHSASPEELNARNAHSTALPVRSPASFIDPVEYATRFASIFEETLRAVRDATINSGSTCLVNRLTSAKSLPVFSGDPLEWHHFKNAYETSTKLGEYSEKENVSRLFDSLKGEARENVSTLLATSQDSDSIMRTLELYYGNKKIVAEKIVSDLKALPGLDSGKINLTRFAAKLKSATLAFKTFKLFGYLHSPELVKCIGDKIPSALRYSYNRYAALVTNDLPELEKLSDYLFHEAELASAAGIFENIVELPTGASTRKPAEKKDSRTTKTGAVHAMSLETDTAVHPAEKSGGKNYVCVVCAEATHHPSRCPLFVSATVDARWRIVKKYNLCFNCLRTGHSRNNCNAKKCSKCNNPHHSMLHVDKNLSDKTPREDDVTDLARDRPTREIHAVTVAPNSP